MRNVLIVFSITHILKSINYVINGKNFFHDSLKKRLDINEIVYYC